MSRNMFLPNLFVYGDLLSKAGSVDDFYDPARDYRTELNRRIQSWLTVFALPLGHVAWVAE